MSDEAADLSRPYVDAARVVADQRRLDPAAKRALYRRVFGGQDGQTVLLDLLVQAGVCTPRPPSLTNEGRIHLDGQAWVVLTAMKDAGYEVADIAATLLSNSMRGLDSHDRHHRNNGDHDDRRDVVLPNDDQF